MSSIKTLFIFFCLSFVFITVQSQTKKEIFLKIDTLKTILSRADTLHSFDDTVENIGDTISSLNDEIFLRLANILTDPAIFKLNLDSLLEHPFLGKTSSKDKRLWIFSWGENTGGSWKSNLNLVHYRTNSKKLKVDYKPNTEDDNFSEQNTFCSNGAWFYKIYKLHAKNKNLYLCMGSGISCNTCTYEIVTVVELLNDSINFTYPAFQQKNNVGQLSNDETQSCFTLDAKGGDIERFHFNPATQILTFIFLTDDNTPVKSEKQKRIIRRLVFDGNKFIQYRKRANYH